MQALPGVPGQVEQMSQEREEEKDACNEYGRYTHRDSPFDHGEKDTAHVNQTLPAC